MTKSYFINMSVHGEGVDTHFAGLVEMDLRLNQVNHYCRDIIKKELELDPKLVSFKVIALNNIEV